MYVHTKAVTLPDRSCCDIFSSCINLVLHSTLVSPRLCSMRKSTVLFEYMYQSILNRLCGVVREGHWCCRGLPLVLGIGCCCRWLPAVVGCPSPLLVSYWWWLSVTIEGPSLVDWPSFTGGGSPLLLVWSLSMVAPCLPVSYHWCWCSSESYSPRRLWHIT